MEKSSQFLVKEALSILGQVSESCALTFDKSITKNIFQKNGINTPLFEIISKDNNLDLGKLRLKYPLIVKPVNEGSSIGILKAL